MKHQKHANITRPALGQFGRQEWAILGTPCGRIKELAFALTKNLQSDYKVAYVDADHASADEAAGRLEGALGHGATLEYTDMITHHRFDRRAELNKHQYRTLFNEQDVVLVNGNHFQADRQIVVIDPVKEKSLRKRMDQLTQVDLILYADGAERPFDFFREAFPDWQELPQWSLAATDRTSVFLRKQLQIPPLHGLVLAGGKSQRMGQDKGLIDYHGKPQREYMADMLSALCDETYISCRPEQMAELPEEYRALPDTFSGLGPFGAITSAFRQNPNAAWLVVACDLPLLDRQTLQQLVGARNPSEVATAFNSPVTEFPEPLIAIWEPRAYPVLLQFLAQGYSCPRKALINSPVKLLDAEKPDALMNVNHPEELAKAKKRLTVK